MGVVGVGSTRARRTSTSVMSSLTMAILLIFTPAITTHATVSAVGSDERQLEQQL